MSDSNYQQWVELSWQRELTPAEKAQLEACLAAQPELRSRWETEAALSQALRQMPEVRVPSNFTSLVMQAVERDLARSSKDASKPHSVWRVGFGWVSRLATAGLVMSLLALGVFFFLQQGRLVQRQDMARSVETVTLAANVPHLEWLEDFDTIARLNDAPAADTELLALLTP